METLPRGSPAMVQFSAVLVLHAVPSILSGLAALAYPPLFGAVFPSLTSSETVACIIRFYGILVTTQVALLAGVRRIFHPGCLQQVALVYCFVFGGTATVAHHSKIPIGGWPLTAMWLLMTAAYGLLALVGSPGAIHGLSYLHAAVVCCPGLACTIAPGMLNQFLQPETQSTYKTISRYYGVLILGTSFLALTLRNPQTAAAWPIARRALSAMFAASGVSLSMAMFGGQAKRVSGSDPLADILGAFSLALFFGLATLYAISDASHAYADHRKRV
mmetsp:Transcript_15807/g.43538  ORF Transcript_15807/g.43538 Transcript_15807/m.43538 type:complete len:274 (-) Transcript_15807:60-881(-)